MCLPRISKVTKTNVCVCFVSSLISLTRWWSPARRTGRCAAQPSRRRSRSSRPSSSSPGSCNTNWTLTPTSCPPHRPSRSLTTAEGGAGGWCSIRKSFLTVTKIDSFEKTSQRIYSFRAATIFNVRHVEIITHKKSWVFPEISRKKPRVVTPVKLLSDSSNCFQHNRRASGVKLHTPASRAYLDTHLWLSDYPEQLTSVGPNQYLAV